ncbi:phage portal protein [Aquamicrobium sp.]|uniref:phage portal protein n=1 Tax=Aquamicrobium sp. TaxID=1872579 RepID=UPI00349E722D
MDRLLQPATPPLDLRRQDTRRGLCYGRNDGEIGGVKTNPIHLSQAAKLSHQAGPPHIRLRQDEVFHLVGLTLDGVHGVSAIAYARETIGLSLAMEDHGATTFRNGARVSGVLKHPNKLGPEAVAHLKAGLEEFRSGGEQEGKNLILEEGMDYARIAMTAEDAQWIESRKFSRTDIAMFFGVPPHMIGDTEKSTSWGTGIEQQSIGFVAYTLEDHLTMWEEAINRDLIGADDMLYARFNRAALVKGDIKARWEAYVKGLQWGVYSPNEIRALEDQNPREGGDIFYPPPNTAGVPAGGDRDRHEDDGGSDGDIDPNDEDESR